MIPAGGRSLICSVALSRTRNGQTLLAPVAELFTVSRIHAIALGTISVHLEHTVCEHLWSRSHRIRVGDHANVMYKQVFYIFTFFECTFCSYACLDCAADTVGKEVKKREL